MGCGLSKKRLQAVAPELVSHPADNHICSDPVLSEQREERNPLENIPSKMLPVQSKANSPISGPNAPVPQNSDTSNNVPLKFEGVEKVSVSVRSEGANEIPKSKDVLEPDTPESCNKNLQNISLVEETFRIADRETGRGYLDANQVRKALASLGRITTDIHSGGMYMGGRCREDQKWLERTISNCSESAKIDLEKFQQIEKAASRRQQIISFFIEANLFNILEDKLPQDPAMISDMDDASFLALFDKNSVLRIGNAMRASAALLKAKKLPTAQEANSKFSGLPGAFKGSFGNQSLFHAGLEECIGLPDPKILRAILMEHLQSSNSRTEFVTTNYGIRTTPEQEMEFALGREEDERFLAEHLLATPDGAEILLSLPWWSRETQRFSFPWTAQRRDPWPADHMRHGRARRTLRELMALPDVARAGLSVAEAIVAYLYTGPMFNLWNAVLRNFPQPLVALLDGNRYTTSIHALVSAVLKLARVTPVPEGRVVYRGLGGMVLDEDTWFRRDERGCRGGVELGFLSTTTNRAVAVQYSGADRDRGIVFEIGVGQVDCGASLREISQYAGEDELLFCPLSNLEVVGDPRVDQTEDGRELLVVALKVNVNLKSETIEEVVSKRKRGHVELMRNLMKEMRFELRQHPRTRALPDAEVEALLGGCREYLEELRRLPAAWFNNDDNYTLAWKQALERKAAGVNRATGQGPAWWVEDLAFVPRPPDAFRAALAHAADMATADALARAALGLAKERKFVRAGLEEVDLQGQGPLMAQAAAGNVEAVKLLLIAGADPLLQDREGCTALHLAVRRDLREVAALLAQAGGPALLRAQTRGREGDAALHLAARLGLADMARMLIECGAEVGARGRFGGDALALARDHPAVLEVLRAAGAGGWTPLMVAADKGDAAAVEALLAAGPGVARPAARNEAGQTAADLAAKSAADRAAGGPCRRALLVAVGYTPLMLELAEGGDTGRVRAVLDGGADVGARDGEGRTALAHAAAAGRTGAVALLLERGADAGAVDAAGKSVLEQTRAADCRRLLRLAGADGWTALMVAAAEGDAARIREIAAAAAAGGGVDAVNADGDTALHLAARKGSAEAVEALVAAGAALDAKDRREQTALALTGSEPVRAALRAAGADGWTPLMVAALAGDAAAVRAALAAAPAAVDAVNADGATALHVAAQAGSAEAVAALAAAGAALNRRDRAGRTPMRVAAAEPVRAALRAAGADGWRTPLMEAAAAGDAERVRALLAEGAAVGVRDERGRSALELAAGEECVAALRAAGADGWTPLMVAADKGDAAAVEALLAAGGGGGGAGGVAARNAAGATALHAAAERGAADVLRLLLAARADVEAADGQGRTALDLAVRDACRDVLRRAGAGGWTPLMVAASRGNVEEVTALLAAGASGVDAQNRERMGALHLAAERGCAGAVRALLARGADANAAGRLGWTPLALARRNAECVAALRAAGADGWTALMVAADGGDPGAVAALLAGGADPAARNRDGATALHLAAARGCAGAVEALLGAGADADAQDKYGRPAAAAARDPACRALLAAAAAARAGGGAPNGASDSRVAGEAPAPGC